MTRHKSRVARRSRHRARRGTRKQSGGAWYNPLTWGKNPDAASAPVDATKPGKPSWLGSFFGASPENEATKADAVAQPAADAKAAAAGIPPGPPATALPGQGGGRKTRHRRRRSPRRHRK